MSSDNFKFSFTCALLFAIAILVSGFSIGAGMAADQYKKEAIERGFAEYNAQTGVWQWNEGGEKHE